MNHVLHLRSNISLKCNNCICYNLLFYLINTTHGNNARPEKTCHGIISYCSLIWEDCRKLTGLCASSRSHSAYGPVLSSLSWCLEPMMKLSPSFLTQLLLIFIRYSQTKGCSSNTIRLWWRWQWHGCWYWQWGVCSSGAKEGECNFSKKWFIKKVIEKWKI